MPTKAFLPETVKNNDPEFKHARKIMYAITKKIEIYLERRQMFTNYQTNN